MYMDIYMYMDIVSLMRMYGKEFELIDFMCLNASSLVSGSKDGK